MSIHLYENDPRFHSDPTFALNHGSFSVINYGLNNSLRKLEKFAEYDKAEWVGLASSLEIGWMCGFAKTFVITVWETINTLTHHHLMTARHTNPVLFGMSEQISKLYREAGFECRTLTCGCDTDFWYQTKPKNSKFTFLHVNSSNVRSGLDLTLRAFYKAFRKNPDVQLIVKDTNDSPILRERIEELKGGGACIQYVNSRWTKNQVRDLYSEAHVCLNLLRMTSYGFPLLEASACNCLSVTGDFDPTNTLVRPEWGVLVKPSSEINISDKLSELVDQWGLLNTYGGFVYPVEPRFYDFDVDQYAETLRDIYNNWSRYESLDKRSPIVDNFKWVDTAKTLIKYLYGSV